MAILSIKIRIGDRDYPMKVDESEEETLRTAGRMLNEKMRKFKEDYQIEDRQDLLAMVAFDEIVQHCKSRTATEIANEKLGEKINYLNHLISKSFT